MRRHSGERRDSVDDFEHEYNNTFLSEKQTRERVTSCDRPSSCQDGMLDVVSLRGSFHFGQIRVGLGTGDRLCQCKEATISLHKKLPVQIDGEPWRQHAGTLKVTRKKESAVMLHRSADDGGGVVAEMAKLLDWAEEGSLIDKSVHSTLMKEFSRRIENSNRQKRMRSQDNIMHSLKRAIASSQNINSNPYNQYHTWS